MSQRQRDWWDAFWVAFALYFVLLTAFLSVSIFWLAKDYKAARVILVVYSVLRTIDWYFHRNCPAGSHWERWPKLYNYIGPAFRRYFRVTIHRSYTVRHASIFYSYHPHGLYPLGIYTMSMSDRSVDRVAEFTGTVSAQFFIPIYRELMLINTASDVSRGNCRRVLEAGRSLIIALGGVREALLLNRTPAVNIEETKKEVQDRDQVILSIIRIGFFRLARQTKTRYVCPVYCPAEMTLFATAKVVPKWVKSLQAFMKRLVGFAIPVAWGTGGYGGLMPGRGPLDIYVGDPIDVSQEEFIKQNNVTNEEAVIEHLMDLYEAELYRLHNLSKWPQKLAIVRM